MSDRRLPGIDSNHKLYAIKSAQQSSSEGPQSAAAPCCIAVPWVDNSLLRLPTELRLEIYQYVFTGLKSIEFKRERPKAKRSMPPPRTSPPTLLGFLTALFEATPPKPSPDDDRVATIEAKVKVPPLLRVCRQIRREAMAGFSKRLRRYCDKLVATCATVSDQALALARDRESGLIGGRALLNAWCKLHTALDLAITRDFLRDPPDEEPPQTDAEALEQEISDVRGKIRYSSTINHAVAMFRVRLARTNEAHLLDQPPAGPPRK